MPRSTNRILTTHCGSLARPSNLLDLMKAKVHSEPYDHEAYARRVRSAVAEIVHKQVETGIDILTDGEQGKPGFFTYVNERLTGFAPKPGARFTMFADEVAAFPEYYEQYFSQAMLGGRSLLWSRWCTGPVSYQGHEALRQDIDNLKAALTDESRSRLHARWAPAVWA
jgi:5-methyltetrahydropteroyltriglutamate--homocysteine methyltransferase